jgi:hypothetical protein
MIDRDLAFLYGVTTKVLNQAVKRNIKRFPDDFMFLLSDQEKEELVTICDHLKDLKFSYNNPYAFTEQGVAMLSSVLNSERAIQVNIAIMRVFVRIKQMISAHKELAHKLEQLEQKVGKNSEDIQLIFSAIHKLMEPPPAEASKKIGFRSDP